MPRQARIVIPNYPHHVVQRGHDKKPVFRNAGDRKRFLEDLRAGKRELGCRVYAYCLMENHVHLIVDPGDRPETLGLFMKWVSGKHAMRINRTSDRRGSLWESRYRSSIIASDRYLLACGRYVEMNPVRAGIANSPDEFPWSSFRQKVGLEFFRWLDKDPAYLSFGSSRAKREIRYRKWVLRSVWNEKNDFFRESLRRGHVTGDRESVEKVFQLTGRWLGPKRRGRPGLQKRGTVPN
jgi:putative transposase